MEHHSNPWLRSGATVYQLMHHGWNKGVETFRNAFSLHVSPDRDSGYDGEELARRIVACVNACSGLETSVLELGRVSPDAFRLEESRADKTERQCDELLAALLNLELGANTIDACYTRNPGNFASALCDLREYAAQARGAIASAKGL